MRFVNIDTTYAEYALLSEDDRFGYDFQVQYGNLARKDYFSSLSLEKRPFGVVKELMSSLKKGDLEALVTSVTNIEDYAIDVIVKEPAYKFIITLEIIIEKLKSLMEMEKTMLTPSVQGKDYSSQLEQVDFSMFSTEYVQTRELANNDILKFEEVRKIPYEECFVELLYRQKQDDFEKLIVQQAQMSNR